MDLQINRRSTFLFLLLAYFCLHACVRGLVSPSLNFDESEQSFLSQTLAWGYNSQPPLYTWLQKLFFETLGYNVFALAVLKNVLLLLTYWFLFRAIEAVTDSIPLAIVGSLGMLTIPQIAWESHRDLTHTVAATCMTCAIFYCIVSMAGQKFWKPWLGYVCLGVIVAAGIMFKYNFGIVVVAFFVSALTIRDYRPLLLDLKMLLSVVVSGILLLPHLFWFLDNSTIASRKTLQTLTGERSDYWVENLWMGSQAFVGSTLACCGLTLVVFMGFYFRRKNVLVEPTRRTQAAALLVERFLIVVAVVLVFMVVSGNAIEFKNRWLQPFVCMLPAYLVLKFGGHVLSRPGSQKLAQVMTVVTMIVLLCAMTARPIAAQWRGKYCWLNMPYDQLAVVLEETLPEKPEIIVTPHMRLAGNLRVFVPESTIMSHDCESSLPRSPADAVGLVVVVTDNESSKEREIFLRQVAKDAGGIDLLSPWTAVELPMRYGAEGATATYHFRTLRPTGAKHVAERTNLNF